MANSRCVMRPKPPACPVDRDVVGRIGEDQAGLLARHQGREHGRVAHIATDQPVRPELPDVAPADPGGGGIREDVVGRVIRLLGGDGRQEGVDLRNREAGDPDLKVKVLSQERPQFRGEPVLVPAGIERQFVVGEDIGALLGLAQVRAYFKSISAYSMPVSCPIRQAHDREVIANQEPSIHFVELQRSELAWIPIGPVTLTAPERQVRKVAVRAPGTLGQSKTEHNMPLF